MAKKTTKVDIKDKAEKATKSAAKSATKAKKRVEAAVHDAVENAGKKIRETAEHAMHNVSALNARVIDHAEENAKEAFAALRKITTSKDVKDIVRIQADFVKEQSARSVAQVKEVGEMIASFGRMAVESVRPKK